MQEPVPVLFSGLTGVNSCCNDVYDPMGERRRGAPLHRGRAHPDRWLVLTSAGWVVQSTEQKEADGIGCYLRATGPQKSAPSPLDVPLAAWEVYDGSAWVHQDTMRVGQFIERARRWGGAPMRGCGPICRGSQPHFAPR